MMYNSQQPAPSELPSTGQLIKATIFALITATAILVTVILPAEYGVDPTGIGRALGFTQMGEIKQQLSEEAVADAQLAQSEATAQPTVTEGENAPLEESTPNNSDTMEVTLVPGEAAEIKVDMAEGAVVQYEWSVSGGHVNFDTHGDAPGISYHGYNKGRESTGEAGELTAAFDGSHGWYWRNRSGATVTVTLDTNGGYTEIKRVV